MLCFCDFIVLSLIIDATVKRINDKMYLKNTEIFAALFQTRPTSSNSG